MDIHSMEADINVQMDPSPLLTVNTESNDHEQIINIITADHASSSSSTSVQPSVPNQSQIEDRLSMSSDYPSHQSSSIQWNLILSNSSAVMPRGGGSGYFPNEMAGVTLSCVEVEFIVTLIQIMLSSLVLLLLGDDDVPPIMFTWVATYAGTCLAILPAIYWRSRNRDLGTEQFPQAHEDSSGSDPLESVSYTAIPANQHLDEVNHPNTRTSSMRLRGNLSMLLKQLMDHFKRVLDLFFACWFCIAYKWITDEPPPSQAAAAFWMLLMVLEFICILSGLPIAFYAIVCICMALVNKTRRRAAAMETRYRFKKMLHGDVNQGVSSTDQDAEKELSLSEEDAVCCICLARYVDNDELKELPCNHTFHAGCVDKWLEIKAICPLCKSEVRRTYCWP